MFRLGGLMVCLLTGTALALYPTSSDVVSLTASNFDRLVEQSNAIWIVEFFAPWCGHCKALTPEYLKAATALKVWNPPKTVELVTIILPNPAVKHGLLRPQIITSGKTCSPFDGPGGRREDLLALRAHLQKHNVRDKGIVKVGAVNCDDEKSLASRFAVQGFPTIKIFGPDKKKPKDYQGPRTAQGLADEAIATIRSKVNGALNSKKSSRDSSSDSSRGTGKDVVELTDDNFSSLVYGSTDYWLVEFYANGCGYCERLKPEYAEAATILKGKNINVKLGALDAPANNFMSGQYNVQGYPTLKWFEPGASSPSSAKEFNGGRTASEIVDWILDEVSKNAPPPEALQITNEEIFKKECVNHALCIVAVLPHILDCQSKCRNDYLAILNNNAKNYRKRGWGWVWTEAGAQSDLEHKLEMGGFGYPALAVLGSKKLKFSVMTGSFSNEGINEFLRDISFGKGRTTDLREGKLPTIIEVSPWDGNDMALPDEEDIDLSDVDLDDDDTKGKDEL